MRRLFILILVTLPILSFTESNLEEKIIGNHLLSLQWISWKNFGSAKITKSDRVNTYKVTGIQRSSTNEDYLKIEGLITPISDKHLVFEGTIETSVYYLNGGKSCIRTGKFNFKSSGSRKYWRLQEKKNPCDNAIDYVDLYFVKTD
jgi:hypothetical protein